MIDAYPDADFAGMYGYEKPTDPACAKSRTGFIIVFAGVPVLWQSKLQTETALSTMEAKIIALAACMREHIPIMDMVQSLADAMGIPAGNVNMRVSVHEDNMGALVLAKTLPPQFTPRSKYYATKTIWFREEIHKRRIKLLKIDTTLSSLGISSPRAFLSPRLNTFDPKLLVGMMDDPYKLSLPTIPHKTMTVHGTPPLVVCSFMQVCSLSPSGTTNLQ